MTEELSNQPEEPDHRTKGVAPMRDAALDRCPYEDPLNSAAEPTIEDFRLDFKISRYIVTGGRKLDY
jgi:hypothetical protein